MTITSGGAATIGIGGWTDAARAQFLNVRHHHHHHQHHLGHSEGHGGKTHRKTGKTPIHDYPAHTHGGPHHHHHGDGDAFDINGTYNGLPEAKTTVCNQATGESIVLDTDCHPSLHLGARLSFSNGVLVVTGFATISGRDEAQCPQHDRGTYPDGCNAFPDGRLCGLQCPTYRRPSSSGSDPYSTFVADGEYAVSGPPLQRLLQCHDGTWGPSDSSLADLGNSYCVFTGTPYDENNANTNNLGQSNGTSLTGKTAKAGKTAKGHVGTSKNGKTAKRKKVKKDKRTKYTYGSALSESQEGESQEGESESGSSSVKSAIIAVAAAVIVVGAVGAAVVHWKHQNNSEGEIVAHPTLSDSDTGREPTNEVGGAAPVDYLDVSEGVTLPSDIIDNSLAWDELCNEGAPSEPGQQTLPVLAELRKSDA